MGCMVYGAVWLYDHTVLYGAVWLYGAGREAGQGVAHVWSEIQRNTAKYSRIPYSLPYSPAVAHAAAAARGLDVPKPQYMLPWVLGIAQHLQ